MNLSVSACNNPQNIDQQHPIHPNTNNHVLLNDKDLLFGQTIRENIRLQVLYNADLSNFRGIFAATYNPKKIDSIHGEIMEQIPIPQQNIYFNAQITPHSENDSYVLLEAYKMAPHQILLEAAAIVPNTYNPTQVSVLWTPTSKQLYYKEGAPTLNKSFDQSPPGIPLPTVTSGKTNY